jgi:hypothetical protein
MVILRLKIRFLNIPVVKSDSMAPTLPTAKGSGVLKCSVGSSGQLCSGLSAEERPSLDSEFNSFKE